MGNPEEKQEDISLPAPPLGSVVGDNSVVHPIVQPQKPGKIVTDTAKKFLRKTLEVGGPAPSSARGQQRQSLTEEPIPQTKKRVPQTKVKSDLYRLLRRKTD